MKKQSKKKILIFVFGLLLVSLISGIATLAFLFGAKPVIFIRNIVITDAVFVAFYVAWIKLNKGYESMYKSRVTISEEK